jgi:hypothetical protein
VFDLQGYVTESLLIVTTLLLDRSWAIRGSVGNKFFLLFAPNPNKVLFGSRVFLEISEDNPRNLDTTAPPKPK